MFSGFWKRHSVHVHSCSSTISVIDEGHRSLKDKLYRHEPGWTQHPTQGQGELDCGKNKWPLAFVIPVASIMFIKGKKIEKNNCQITITAIGRYYKLSQSSPTLESCVWRTYLVHSTISFYQRFHSSLMPLKIPENILVGRNSKEIVFQVLWDSILFCSW